MAAQGPDRELRPPADRGEGGLRGRDPGDPRRGRADRRGGGRVRRQLPEPPLDSLYDHLYVLGDQVPGWYGVDERSPDSHAAEEERPRQSVPGCSPSAAPRTRRTRSCGRPRATQPTRRRRTCTDGRDADAGGAPGRDGRGDAPRRERARHGRGRRRLPGLLQGHRGALDEFGEKRVRDTPISENTIVGMGVGARWEGCGRSSRS